MFLLVFTKSLTIALGWSFLDSAEKSAAADAHGLGNDGGFGSSSERIFIRAI